MKATKKTSNKEKLLELHARILYTGCIVDKLGDDLQIVQKRLASLLTDLEKMMKENKRGKEKSK